MKQLQLVSFIACITSLTSMAYAQDKILGGKVVTDADLVGKLTVAVVQMTPGSLSPRDIEGLCSGTLIAQDTVLTAAHCIKGEKPESMRIVFNHNIRAALPGDFRTVTDMKAHPLRVITPLMIRNDVALIHFEGGLKAGYQSAPLLPEGTPVSDGDHVTLAGFGLSSARSSDSAGTLRKVDMTVRQADHKHRQVTFDQTDGHGACNGDSGGPAFLEKEGTLYAWGVTSYGTGSSCTDIGVYTNASEYPSWVKHTTARLRKKAD